MLQMHLAPVATMYIIQSQANLALLLTGKYQTDTADECQPTSTKLKWCWGGEREMVTECPDGSHVH